MYSSNHEQISYLRLTYCTNLEKLAAVVLTREDATVCGFRQYRLTVRQVADTVRVAISTITARHVCVTRNRNETSSFLTNWREMCR